MVQSENSQRQGYEFEVNFCVFLLKAIEECFSNQVSWGNKPQMQESGVQNGRDINAEWEYEQFKFKWWFECKSHKKPQGGSARKRYINKKQVCDKIVYTLTCEDLERPYVYCIVSPKVEVDNFLRKQLILLDKLGKTHFMRWSPEVGNIEKYIALYPSIEDKIYDGLAPTSSPVQGAERDKKLRELKNFFLKHNTVGTEMSPSLLQEDSYDYKSKSVQKQRTKFDKKDEKILSPKILKSESGGKGNVVMEQSNEMEYLAFVALYETSGFRVDRDCKIRKKIRKKIGISKLKESDIIESLMIKGIIKKEGRLLVVIDRVLADNELNKLFESDSFNMGDWLI